MMMKLLGFGIGIGLFAAIVGLVYALSQPAPVGVQPAPRNRGNWDRASQIRFFRNLTLVLAGAAIFYWGVYDPAAWSRIGFGEANELVWSRWAGMLALFVFLAVVIAFLAPAASRKLAFQILLWSAAFLFFGTWLMGQGAQQIHSAKAVITVPKETSSTQQALPQDTPDLPWAWQIEPSKWPQLQVPAHGDSKHVPALFGGHVVWGGSGFTVHCLYAGGRKGIVGNPDKPCSDGTIIESWAHNDGDTLIYAAYAYARADER